MNQESRGFRTLLIVVYGVFAVSATARSLVQILLHFDQAPLAYLLSFFAALTYIALTILLSRRRPLFLWTLGLITVELLGVLTIGGLSVTHGEILGDDTVWSRFGAGYGYVPLALPLIAGASLLLARRETRVPVKGS